eukprot:Blabericola_migrator_1__1891@NODE_1513_length_4373_cov_130_645146_g994_i0_p2_GENE_NODE_1513_length_4373_cov_130_645146_g994_i0NODE_1513_length_4373_cov_130_645146_g994_i0_p2_ORF_typecomplete_len325_score44_03_NODE_1513_length_4373_cov_130_645146_g994_i04671441
MPGLLWPLSANLFSVAAVVLSDIVYEVPTPQTCWVFEPRNVSLKYRCAHTCAQVYSVAEVELFVNHPWQFLCRTCIFQAKDSECLKKRVQECYPSAWDCCRAFHTPKTCLAAGYDLKLLNSYHLMIESCRLVYGSYAAPWCYIVAMFPNYHCGQEVLYGQRDLVNCVSHITKGSQLLAEGSFGATSPQNSQAARGILKVEARSNRRLSGVSGANLSGVSGVALSAVTRINVSGAIRSGVSGADPSRVNSGGGRGVHLTGVSDESRKHEISTTLPQEKQQRGDKIWKAISDEATQEVTEAAEDATCVHDLGLYDTRLLTGSPLDI